MPFGSIFGALFFGGLCVLVAAGLLGHPTVSGKLAGVFLALLGGSLACGLLTRRAWARWGGLLCSALVFGLALPRLSELATVADHLVLLSALATAVLLALPATGRAGAEPPRRRGPGVAGAIAVTSFLGLLVVGLIARGPGAPPAGAQGALPASTLGTRVQWRDLSSGLQSARESGKPVLATFVTSWCPYCNKMRKETWRSAAVVERLASTIPVRVDIENAGQHGPELADRFGIRGYPVQILFAPDGEVLARADGYQTPSQLVQWLDSSLDRFRASNPATAGRTAHR